MTSAAAAVLSAVAVAFAIGAGAAISVSPRFEQPSFVWEDSTSRDPNVNTLQTAPQASPLQGPPPATVLQASPRAPIQRTIPQTTVLQVSSQISTIQETPREVIRHGSLQTSKLQTTTPATLLQEPSKAAGQESPNVAGLQASRPEKGQKLKTASLTVSPQAAALHSSPQVVTLHALPQSSVVVVGLAPSGVATATVAPAVVCVAGAKGCAIAISSTTPQPTTTDKNKVFFVDEDSHEDAIKEVKGKNKTKEVPEFVSYAGYKGETYDDLPIVPRSSDFNHNYDMEHTISSTSDPVYYRIKSVSTYDSPLDRESGVSNWKVIPGASTTVYVRTVYNTSPLVKKLYSSIPSSYVGSSPSFGYMSSSNSPNSYSPSGYSSSGYSSSGYSTSGYIPSGYSSSSWRPSSSGGFNRRVGIRGPRPYHSEPTWYSSTGTRGNQWPSSSGRPGIKGETCPPPQWCSSTPSHRPNPSRPIYPNNPGGSPYPPNNNVPFYPTGSASRPNYPSTPSPRPVHGVKDKLDWSSESGEDNNKSNGDKDVTTSFEDKKVVAVVDKLDLDEFTR